MTIKGPASRGRHDPPPADSIAEFARDLRNLRAQAGSPPFRQMSKVTHYSASTLAMASAGKRLPTEAVLAAFVVACGTDADGWLARLRCLAAEPALAGSPADGTDESATGPAPGRKWWRMAVIVAVASGLVALGGIARGAMPGPHPASGLRPSVSAVFTDVPAPAPTARVADGADPSAAGCAQDARLVDKVPALLDGVQIGAMELKYSGWCGAGWARLYLYPGQPTMMGTVTVSAADGRLAAFGDPLVGQVSIYTNVVVPGPDGCLKANATIDATGHAPVHMDTPCEPIT